MFSVNFPKGRHKGPNPYGVRFREADAPMMTIGMDVLSKLHICYRL